MLNGMADNWIRTTNGAICRESIGALKVTGQSVMVLPSSQVIYKLAKGEDPEEALAWIADQVWGDSEIVLTPPVAELQLPDSLDEAE